MLGKATVTVIHYFTEDTDFQFEHAACATPWIQQVIRQEKHQLSELNFIFCSDAYLHDKNLRYLQQDTHTDVLTFDYAEVPQTLAGDIYLSIDRIRAHAPTYHHTLWQELYTVMVHGVLHLLGYDDRDTCARAQMRAQEALYLAQITTPAGACICSVRSCNSLQPTVDLRLESPSSTVSTVQHCEYK